MALAPPIYTLGPLIHNPSVVARLARRGIAAIDDLGQVGSGTVIVRTHGVDPEVVAAAQARGLAVIDATCPFVNVAHQKAEVLREQGYIPVILGERDHPEVVGLRGLGRPQGGGRRRCRRAAPARRAGQARRGGRADHPDARQPGAPGRRAWPPRPARRSSSTPSATPPANARRPPRSSPARVDVVIVVGGRNSANTTRLASLCRVIQPRTWHIETAAELEGAWLPGRAASG